MADGESISREHVTVLILAVLRDSPAHGYHIMREVERRTGSDIKLRRVTLYLILRDLEADGLITSVWEHEERARHVFRLTQAGLDELEKRLEKWNRFVRAMYRATGEDFRE